MKLSVIPYPLAIALVTSAVFGAAIGSAFVATLMYGRITQTNSTASSLAAQCKTSDTAPVVSLSVASPEPQPQPESVPVTAAITAPVLNGSATSAASSVTRPKPVSQATNVAISKPKLSTSAIDQRPATPISTPSTGHTLPPEDQVTTKPSGESKIDAVYAAKAGVSKVEPDAVTLMTGARVAVGEKFPSGETLVRIDAANMRLFTDRRQLILFSGKEGMQ